MRYKTFALAVILCLCTAVIGLGQTTQTVTTTTVQEPGTYTVIEYPTGKEITVNLNPVAPATGTGVATILRDDEGTKIKLNLSGLPADVTTLNLYAVDEQGAVTSLGPVAIANGSGTFTATSPLNKFMLIASPSGSLTTYDPKTVVVVRSAVPEGMVVVPHTTNPVGEQVSATATPVATATTYTVSMLNLPSYKRGEDTKLKINFTGAMAGARANAFITPRKDGPTEIKIRFHDLKDAPKGKTYTVWAVSPDNKFSKLGQIVNAPGRNEAEIRSETTLLDLGLLITVEDVTGPFASPLGPAVGTFEILK